MSEMIPDIKATADTVVHFLFASPGNEDLLLSLINAVLVDAGHPPVAKVTVRNPFNPKTFLADKDSILDIKAEDEHGKTFTIEFQVAEHDAFVNRILYYWAKCYTGQLQKGNPYQKLQPVVSIVVVEFPLFPELTKLHNTFYIMAQDEPEYVLTEDLQIHTLELTKEKWRQIPMLVEPLRGWLELLYLADKKPETEMKVLLKNDQTLERAYSEYQRFTQDASLRELEEARQKFLHDQATRELSAEKKGREEERIENLLQVLAKRVGKVPPTVRDKLLAIHDLGVLRQLMDVAWDCQTLGEFEEALSK